jgi:hypothetical protein
MSSITFVCQEIICVAILGKAFIQSNLKPREAKMAILGNGFKLGGGLGTGLAIGLGAAVLTPVVLPVLAAVAKPAVKAAMKGSILLYQKGKVMTAEVAETFEDLAAEAQSELGQKKTKPKAKAAAGRSK